VQLDAAGPLALLAHGRELPFAVEVGERAVDQLQLHLTPRNMGVAGGEALVQASECETDFGRHAGLVFLDDA